MFYEMLAGHLPFEAPGLGEIIGMHLHVPPRPLLQVDASIPKELAGLVHRMLAKAPQERPAMREIELELERLGAPRATGTLRPAPKSERSQRPRLALLPAARAARLGGAALATLGLLAGGAYHGWSYLTRPERAMARVPGGTFPMGSSSDDIEAAYLWCRAQIGDECVLKHFEREQPVRAVTVSPFRLDATEVTNERFAAWLNRQRSLAVRDGRYVEDGKVLLADLYSMYSPPLGLVHRDGRFAAQPRFGRTPVTQVTWEAARRYCESQGKRLPTEAEWELAARGREGRRFPWGQEEPRCDGVVFGRIPGGPCVHKGVGPADVGTAEMDRTPEGVFDLAGNVGEWVMDRYRERYPPCAGECVDPGVIGTPGDGDGQRVVRGGGWNLSAASLRAAGRSRWQEGAALRDVGFRCAAAGQP